MGNFDMPTAENAFVVVDCGRAHIYQVADGGALHSLSYWGSLPICNEAMVKLIKMLEKKQEGVDSA